MQLGRCCMQGTRLACPCRPVFVENSRPFSKRQQRGGVAIIRAAASEDLVLVRTEEQQGDTTLFVFGTEAEKSAAPQSSSASSGSSSSSSPSSSSGTATSAPSQEPAPKASQASTPTQRTDPQLEHSRQLAAALATAVQKDEKIEKSVLEEALAEFPEASGNELQKQPSFIRPQTALENLTVIALKELCKEAQITGYSKLKKDELVKALVDSYDQSH